MSRHQNQIQQCQAQIMPKHQKVRIRLKNKGLFHNKTNEFSKIFKFREQPPKTTEEMGLRTPRFICGFQQRKLKSAKRWVLKCISSVTKYINYRKAHTFIHM